MSRIRSSALSFTIAAIGLIQPALAVASDAFPSKPVTMIVPFAAGGAADITARIVAERLGSHLNQSVVVENVPGAGGTIGLSKLARSKPDGYTIGVGNNGTNAAVYTLYPDVKFTANDFAPVGVLSKSFSTIAVKTDSQYQNIESLIKAAKAEPGKLTLGHAGIGSSNYLICLAFLQAAGIEATLVAYRGAAPAMNDMLGGQIDAVCDSSTSVAQHVQSGRAKALIVAGDERAPSLPQAPSAREVNLPGFSMNSWIALFAPEGVPKQALETLQRALSKVLQDEGLLARYQSTGVSMPRETQRDAAYLAGELPKEIAYYKDMIQKAAAASKAN